jgi:type II secretory pathway pseudopilin PulG
MTQLVKKDEERSFTLIETVIALAIITFVIVEVATVQGNAIVFSEFGRHATQGTWLAKRVMAQVEYFSTTKPFKELETSVVEQKFEDFDEYSYSLDIKEWKFPFASMLMMALGGGGDGKETDGGGGPPGISGMIESKVKQVFGDEPIFLLARVDVSWPEGAVRGSTGLSYLMTNQAKIDQATTLLRPVYERLTKPKTPPPQGTPVKPTTGGPQVDVP